MDAETDCFLFGIKTSEIVSQEGLTENKLVILSGDITSHDSKNTFLDFRFFVCRLLSEVIGKCVRLDTEVFISIELKLEGSKGM